jgi:hypothetical protein
MNKMGEKYDAYMPRMAMERTALKAVELPR